MLPRHITASILSLAVCAMPLAAACDHRPSTEHVLATIANDCHD